MLWEIISDMFQIENKQRVTPLAFHSHTVAAVEALKTLEKGFKSGCSHISLTHRMQTDAIQKLFQSIFFLSSAVCMSLFCKDEAAASWVQHRKGCIVIYSRIIIA